MINKGQHTGSETSYSSNTPSGVQYSVSFRHYVINELEGIGTYYSYRSSIHLSLESPIEGTTIIDYEGSDDIKIYDAYLERRTDNDCAAAMAVRMLGASLEG